MNKSNPAINITRTRWRHPEVKSLLRRSLFTTFSGIVSTTAYATPIDQSDVQELSLRSKESITTQLHTSQSGLAPISVFNFRLFSFDSKLVLRLSNGQQFLFHPHQAAPIHEQVFEAPEYPVLGRILHYEFNNRFHRLNRINLTSQPRSSDDGSNFSSALRSADGAVLSDEVIERIRAIILSLQGSVCLIPNTDDIPILIAGLPDALDPTSADTCQDPSTPLPVGFDDLPPADVIRIEARPANCHSFFTAYSGIARGTAIETALTEYAPYTGSQTGGRSFPVVDFWNNGAAYVLTSRDLTADAYDDAIRPQALFDQILRDAENIQDNILTPLRENGSLSHTEMGTTSTLYPEDVQTVYLDIVVQFGVMSDAQSEQINLARELLLDRFGILLRVVEIP